MADFLDLLNGHINEEINSDLEKWYTQDEVEIMLKQMNPTKAPRLDGMPLIFFQKYWHVTGKALLGVTLKALNNGAFHFELNQTHWVNDYKPISLCNVTYKLIAKDIANRLKKWLPTIISPSQSVFVLGRLITDNVLVAHELLHQLK